MDIDFSKPLTDEAKAYLKGNLGQIEAAAGVVTLDPQEPLSRTAMEQLRIRHKIAGQEEEFSVWDATQRAAKSGGADKATKDAKDALAFKAAADRIRAANAAGETPGDEDVNLVLGGLHPDPNSLLQDDDGPAANAKGRKPAKPPAGDDVEQRINAAVAAGIKEALKGIDKRLLPTEHHGAFLSEQLDAEAGRILKETIGKAVSDNPAIKTLTEKIGKDPNRKAILERVNRLIVDTVDQQARGRIEQMRSSGSGGDILGEIPAIVKGTVEAVDPQSLLDKAAPQPILLGGSSPDDVPLRVLSTDEPPARPKLDDPDFDEKMAQRWAHRAAMQAAGAGSP